MRSAGPAVFCLGLLPIEAPHFPVSAPDPVLIPEIKGQRCIPPRLPSLVSFDHMLQEMPVGAADFLVLSLLHARGGGARLCTTEPPSAQPPLEGVW